MPFSCKHVGFNSQIKHVMHRHQKNRLPPPNLGGNNLLNKIKGGLLITLCIIHLLYVIQVTAILKPY